MKLKNIIFLLLLISCSFNDVKIENRFINYSGSSVNDLKKIPSSIKLLFKRDYKTLPKKLSPGYFNDPQNVYKSYQIVDVEKGIEIEFANLSPYKKDTPQEFLDNKVWYRILSHKGKEFSELKPIISDAYNLDHPFEFVFIGKNGFTLANSGIISSNGEYLIPFYFAPLDETGNYFNPLKTHTFSYCGILIGEYLHNKNDIKWKISEIIKADYKISTRGFSESTIVELNNEGEFLLIMRTSNQKQFDKLPSYKYKVISKDFGRTWSKPSPLTYSNGENFFSPSSESELVRSPKSQKLYWLGNISESNPVGNKPRYPLVIGEVDEENISIIKNTVKVIDDRNPDYDSEEVQLSNFLTCFHPENKNLIIRLNRIDKKKSSGRTQKFTPCFYEISL